MEHRPSLQVIYARCGLAECNGTDVAAPAWKGNVGLLDNACSRAKEPTQGSLDPLI